MKKFTTFAALALFAGISSHAVASPVECKWTCQKQDEYGICIEWISVCDDHKGAEPTRFALPKPETPELLSRIPANTRSFHSLHDGELVELSKLTKND